MNQENLDVFFGLAEELRLKGQTGSPTEDNTWTLKAEASEQEKKFQKRNRLDRKISRVPTPLNEYNHKTSVEHSSTALVSSEADQLDERIWSIVTRTEKR